MKSSHDAMMMLAMAEGLAASNNYSRGPRQKLQRTGPSKTVKAKRKAQSKARKVTKKKGKKKK